MGMDRDVLWSSYGGVFTCFNVGIMTQALSLLQCYPHPNSKWSLRASADVLCGEVLWVSLLSVAIPAILVFVIGYCVAISFACAVAPKRFHQINFRKRWKFLFVKFRPSVWWWSLIMF